MGMWGDFSKQKNSMNENYIFINDSMDSMGLHEAAHAISLPLPGL